MLSAAALSAFDIEEDDWEDPCVASSALLASFASTTSIEHTKTIYKSEESQAHSKLCILAESMDKNPPPPALAFGDIGLLVDA